MGRVGDRRATSWNPALEKARAVPVKRKALVFVPVAVSTG